MADKSIDELIQATTVLMQDLFVLQQNGTAKSVTGQTLIRDLLKAMDGHGGIRTVELTKSEGLTDTYTITLADGTEIPLALKNGRSIQNVSKSGTTDLTDTYRISFNDGTFSDFAVTNGAKGEKGDNTYVHIKFASQMPTDTSHSIGDAPDNWVGIYWGSAANPPADWQAYTWTEIKGAKGNTGDPASILAQSVGYQASDSGTIIPSGTWKETVPVVPGGKYLWTRTVLEFNSGSPVTAYSVGHMGLDGSGSVSSVCDISPNSDGNVELTAENVGALPTTGGDMTGEIRMNGQPISGLNDPTEDTEAARKGYVDAETAKCLALNGSTTMTGNLPMGGKKITGLGTPTANTDAVPKKYVDDVKTLLKSVTVTLPASGWTGTDSYTQTVTAAGMTAAWIPGVPSMIPMGGKTENLSAQEALGCISLIESKAGALTFTCYENKPKADITIRIPGTLE